MGACHIALGAACLGAYTGVGAFHSIRQNSYLGSYPGYYGTSTSIFLGSRYTGNRHKHIHTTNYYLFRLHEHQGTIVLWLDLIAMHKHYDIVGDT